MAKQKPKQKRTTRAPKKAKRRRSKPDWSPAFLRALALDANVKAACEASGVGRSTVYERRDSDAEFALKMADALDDAVDDLELEARRRAHDGVTRLKVHQGQAVMVPLVRDGVQVLDAQNAPVLVPLVEREYSDTLMIFLLKAHRPEKYRDVKDVRHSGPGGGPIEVNATHADKNPFPSLEALRAYAAGLASRPDAAGAGGAALRADGGAQPVDPPPAAPQAGGVPAQRPRP